MLFIKKLKDDHLVKLVKAYKHGDSYNFIFPYAKTNLDRHLRNTENEPFTDADSVPGHPLWRQGLYLAQALHKVLDGEDPGTTDQTARFGYHLDLKPANILVDDRETLIISDFGEARFKEIAGATSSKVVGMGGTEAYAPPEIDDKRVIHNRKYDIWSFGCVLVEIATFIVKGPTGVLELDSLRLTEIPHTNGTDDRFFRPKSNHQGSGYELKPEIKKWIQELPQVVRGRSRDFSSKIILLALKMLNVDVKHRITSKDVCIELSLILDQFQSGFETTVPNQLASTPSYRGSEFGRESIKKVILVCYNINGSWQTGPVHFTQEKSLLYIRVLENKEWILKLLGDRSLIRLVPTYALQSSSNMYYSDTFLYLFLKKGSADPSRHCGKFSANAFTEILHLQELLLGYKVNFNLRLASAQVEVKHRKTVLEIFQHKHSRISLRGQKDLRLDAPTIQLWNESPYSNSKVSKEQFPRSFYIGPPVRRIAILGQSSI